MTHSRRPLRRAALCLAAASFLATVLAPGCRKSGSDRAPEERPSAPVTREAAPVTRERAPVRGREELSRLNKAPRSETVYITESGKKYHRRDCNYLKKSRQAIPRSTAKAKHYSACTVCDP